MSATQPSNRVGRAPTALGRALFDAANAHDLDALMAGMHPDVVADFIAVERFDGVDQYRTFWAEVFGAFPDLSLAIEATYETGNVATIQWSASGTFNGDRTFQGIKPTGQHMEWRGCDVMEFEGDLLRRNTVYYDALGVSRQMGLLPRKGSTGDRAVLRLFNTATRLRGLLRRR